MKICLKAHTRGKTHPSSCFGAGGGSRSRLSARLPPKRSGVCRPPAPPGVVLLRCCLRCVSSSHLHHLWQCFHHGGHFSVDVFCHRGPRLPLLHYLHAVIMRRLAQRLRRSVHRSTRDVCFSSPASLVSIMDNGNEALRCM